MSTQAKIILSAEDRATPAFKTFQDNIQQTIRGTDLLRRSVAGLVAGLTVDRAIGYARGLAEIGIQAERLSKLSGVSVKDFQAQAYAAEKAGIGADKYASILKDVQDKVGEFLQTGGGPLKDFFENIAPRVGVTAEQFRKLGGSGALQLYASSLEKANLSQSELTFYMEALASDSATLLPLLKNNAEAMKRYGVEARGLGLIMSEQAIAETRKFDAELRKLQSTADGFGRTFSIPILTEVNAIIEKFREGKKEGRAFWEALFLSQEEMERKNRAAGAFGMNPDSKRSVTGAIINDGDPRSAIRGMDRNIEWGPIEDRAGKPRPNGGKPRPNGGKPRPNGGKPAPASLLTFDPEMEAISAEFEKLYQIRDDRSAQAKQIYEEMLTPIERLAKKEAELDRLRRDGLVSEETAARARFAAAVEFDLAMGKTKDAILGVKPAMDDMTNAALIASERIQGAMGDELSNILRGNFKDIGDSFANMVERMLAEAASARIMDGLFGAIDPTTKKRSGGGALDGVSEWFGDLLSFDGGGYTGTGARAGGIDGRGGFLAMLHPRETVVDHTRGQGAGGVTVNIINQGGERLAVDRTQERTGPNGKMIYDVFVSSLANDLAARSGPVSRALESGWGIRPSNS